MKTPLLLSLGQDIPIEWKVRTPTLSTRRHWPHARKVTEMTATGYLKRNEIGKAVSDPAEYARFGRVKPDYTTHKLEQKWMKCLRRLKSIFGSVHTQTEG